jgi:hypothetical protein
MIEKRFIDLLNREIDETLLPDERAMLEEFRSGNPEAKKISRDLEFVASKLQKLQEVDAPSTLKLRVMNAIAPHVRAQERPFGQAVRAAVAGFFQPRRGIRLAYAFSGGLAIGVLLFAIYLSIGGRNTFDSSDAIGTMIVSSSRNLQMGPEFPINTANIRGVVRTQHNSDISVLTVNLQSESEVVTRISYDPGSLNLKAVRRSEGMGDNLTARGGELELRSSGDHTYAVYFGNVSNGLSTVRVTMSSSGNPLFDNEIPLGTSHN